MSEQNEASVQSVVHTPGPWVYDSGCFYAQCQLDKNGMTQESPIAELLEGRPDDSKGNARLIAAAPTMLEALRRIVRQKDIVGGTMAKFSPTRQIAAQAIQDATGEQV
jgi:hypothetical protein